MAKIAVTGIGLIGYGIAEWQPHAYAPSAVPDRVSLPPVLIWVAAAVAAWLMPPRVGRVALTVFVIATGAQLLTTEPLGAFVRDDDKLAELASFVSGPLVPIAGITAIGQLLVELLAARRTSPS